MLIDDNIKKNYLKPKIQYKILQKMIMKIVASNAFESCLYFQIFENEIQRKKYYSGTVTPSAPYISTGRSVSLFFESDGSNTDSGFQLTYQSKLDVQ